MADVYVIQQIPGPPGPPGSLSALTGDVIATGPATAATIVQITGSSGSVAIPGTTLAWAQQGNSGAPVDATLISWTPVTGTLPGPANEAPFQLSTQHSTNTDGSIDQSFSLGWNNAGVGYVGSLPSASFTIEDNFRTAGINQMEAYVSMSVPTVNSYRPFFASMNRATAAGSVAISSGPIAGDFIGIQQQSGNLWMKFLSGGAGTIQIPTQSVAFAWMQPDNGTLIKASNHAATFSTVVLSYGPLGPSNDAIQVGDTSASANTKLQLNTNNGSLFLDASGPGAANLGLRTQDYGTTGQGCIGLGPLTVYPTTIPSANGAVVGLDGTATATKGLHYFGSGSSFFDQMLIGTLQGTVNTQVGKIQTYPGVARTTTNAAVTIFTIPLATSATNAGIEVLVQGRDVTSGTVTDGVTIKTVFQFKNVSGTLSQGATTATPLKANDTSMAGCTLTATFSGTNALVQVTGLSATTIDWTGLATALIT